MPWRRPSFKRIAVGTKLQRPWPADQRACCTSTLVRSLAVDRWGDRSRRSALQPLSPGAPRDVEIGTGWGRLIARNLGEAIGVGPPAIMQPVLTNALRRRGKWTPLLYWGSDDDDDAADDSTPTTGNDATLSAPTGIQVGRALARRTRSEASRARVVAAGNGRRCSCAQTAPRPTSPLSCYDRILSLHSPSHALTLVLLILCTPCQYPLPSSVVPELACPNRPAQRQPYRLHRACPPLQF